MLSYLQSIMSIDGSGDVNVFFSSSRVGFGEPPPQATTTSLLTFADMVLALDHKNVREESNMLESTCAYGIKKESDHTYASSGSNITTRSQTAKAALAALKVSRLPDEEEKTIPLSQLKMKDESALSTDEMKLNFQHASKILNSEENLTSLKHKRCSSVENLNCDIDNNRCKIETQCETQGTVSRACEWPNVLSKNSPRKSCSFEEVSFDSGKSSIKTSKSTESVQKTGISHTLHRLVNDTLEFPCWPRKADHTYATATWDGTAASHSLFEQETLLEAASRNGNEDHEMEVADHDYVSNTDHTKGRDSDKLIVGQAQMLQNFFLSGMPQKDDHTYVRPKSVLSSTPESNDDNTLTISENAEIHQFSSATFPRQKMRDDHTYFHSGLSRKSSGSVGARDWVSPQSTASSIVSQDMRIEEAYRSLNSFSQSSSAKKDHNYSTSS